MATGDGWKNLHAWPYQWRAFNGVLPGSGGWHGARSKPPGGWLDGWLAEVDANRESRETRESWRARIGCLQLPWCAGHVQRSCALMKPAALAKRRVMFATAGHAWRVCRSGGALERRETGCPGRRESEPASLVVKHRMLAGCLAGHGRHSRAWRVCKKCAAVLHIWWLSLAAPAIALAGALLQLTAAALARWRERRAGICASWRASQSGG